MSGVWPVRATTRRPQSHPCISACDTRDYRLNLQKKTGPVRRQVPYLPSKVAGNIAVSWSRPGVDTPKGGP